MEPSEYPTVLSLKNDTFSELHLHLEMIPEEVILSAGHAVDLLAKPTDDLLPLTVDYIADGLLVCACREFDPDWHVRFMGKVIKAASPTRLKEYE